jgi:hypothetical protein
LKDKKETKGQQTNKYGDVEFTDEQMEEFREAFLGNSSHHSLRNKVI